MQSLTMARAASRNLSGATTASTAPSFNATSALRSAPVAIHSTAVSRPITRGRRTVPPKPGKMPSFTSGKPIFAVADMTLKSHARASSVPPPRQTPLIAATRGMGRSSKRARIWWTLSRCRTIASGPSANQRPNSVMSAPTTKTPLPEVRTIPLTLVSFAIACVAAAKSSRASALILLTDSPARSNLTSTMPSSSAVTLKAGPECNMEVVSLRSVARGAMR